MLSTRLSAVRIPSLRPLRPPNVPALLPKPRPFTSNTQLLILSPRTLRPQLPYLAQPALHRTKLGSSQHLAARLLSTETKRYVREQFWLATKWTAIIWTFAILGGITYFGAVIEIDERRHPTPSEWTFSTRHCLRGARAHLSAEARERVGFVDWARIGGSMRQALDRLEDAGTDGKGLEEPAGDETLIPGVGRAGYDISGKSWPWRAGYFEVIMGCAMAAEHLDSMVLDKTRGIVFPADVVLGPSNPDPRPTPPYMAAAPKEEDCVAPYDKPETFYMRILTGKGFSTGQRLDAVLGYANWLQYKGLVESAEEVLLWGVDIAVSGLPSSLGDRNAAETVIDKKTGVLKDLPPLRPETTAPATAATGATPNLLRVTTALAIHHARTGNLAAALPIFLSVLRARRQAPVSSFPPLYTSDDTSEVKPSTWLSFLSPPAFPPPPPSGDQPVVRLSAESTCEESELMLYIGEILFASASGAEKEGISWTRQAVSIADTNLQNTRGAQDDEERRKCRECLITGTGNWDLMVRKAAAAAAAGNDGTSSQKAGWFSWWSTSAQQTKAEEDDLAAQAAQIEALKSRFVREGIEREMLRARGGNTSGVWIG